MPRKDTSHLVALVHDAIPTFNLRQLAAVLLKTSIAIRDRGMTPHLLPRRQELALHDDKGDLFATMTCNPHDIPTWKTYTPQIHPLTPDPN